jgi:hypothetical protein
MNVDAEGYKRFVKKILSVSVILLALFSIPSICESATIRESVMEIHSGAGRLPERSRSQLHYIEKFSAVPIFRK